MRPSDKTPVCSRIMTAIKMVASISFLWRTIDTEYAQALCRNLYLEKGKWLEGFLNPSGGVIRERVVESVGTFDDTVDESLG